VDLGHRLGAGGVEPDGVAGEHLVEVGPRRVEVDRHVGDGVVGRRPARAQHHDGGPGRHLVVHRHRDRGHRPGGLGGHVVVHLHRLDHGHHLAGPDGVAHGHPHLHDEPLQG
jgi:hypothetical protein